MRYAAAFRSTWYTNHYTRYGLSCTVYQYEKYVFVVCGISGFATLENCHVGQYCCCYCWSSIVNPLLLFLYCSSSLHLVVELFVVDAVVDEDSLRFWLYLPCLPQTANQLPANAHDYLNLYYNSPYGLCLSLFLSLSLSLSVALILGLYRPSSGLGLV